MLFLISIVVLFGLIAIPLLPGVLELQKPKDDDELVVSATFLRDPRFFSNSFRAKIAPLLSHPPASLPLETNFLTRGNEKALIDTSFVMPQGGRRRQIFIALDSISAGNNVRLLDAFSGNTMTAGNHLCARALASDGTITLGDGAKIERWIDGLSDVRVGRSSELGLSASSTAAIIVGPNCSFERLFGFPVQTESHPAADFSQPNWKRARVIAAGSSVNENIICREPLILEPDCAISGSIKCYSNVFVGKNVNIHGNVISRANIQLCQNVRIDGHVFSERSVKIAGKFTLGTLAAQKSIYAAEHIELGPDIAVYGWIVSEGGGKTT